MKIPRFNYEENRKINIYLDTKILDLVNSGQLSVRAYHVCFNHKFSTISDLQKFGDQYEDFIKLRNCGQKTALELYGLLKRAKSSYAHDIEISEDFKLCPESTRNIFTTWLNSIKSNSEDKFYKFLIELLPSAGKIYDVLLKNPFFILNARLYDTIQDDKLKFQYRSNIVKKLIQLRDVLKNSVVNDNNTLKIISNITVLPTCIREDFAIEFFKYDLSEERRFYLCSNFNLLINRAPKRAQNLFFSHIKNIEGIIPYLNFEFSQFRMYFGNKRKGAVDFYNEVLEPFRESYNSVISNSIDDLEILIKYKYPFLEDTEVKFVKEFFYKHKYYPMFYISHALLVNSKQRELDFLSMKYGLGKYKPHTLEQIAASYSLSKERVRQIMSQPILTKNKLFHSMEWEPYFKLGNIFITENSDFFKTICREEQLSMSFECFALFYNSVFNYEYYDSNFKFIVDKKYAVVLNDVLKNVIQLKNQNHPNDLYLTLDAILPKNYVEDEYLGNLIYTDICPLLDIEIKENKLYFEQNHIDISSEIYNYLYSSGEPKHIEDIREYLSKKYPHKSFSNTNLKFKIREHSSILPVGNSSKYKLKHWRNIYGGSIRSLIRDILNESETPLSLDVIADKVTDIYESTNRKNVHSSMSSCEDFVPFSGGLWGLENKQYSSEYVIVDLSRNRNSFEERFEQYKSFVEEFRRLPYQSGIEEEDSLKRWQTNVIKRILDVSDEQINLLKEYMKSNAHLPQNGKELRFYKTCKEYLDFVEENYELPSYPSPLYYWFKKNLNSYMEYEDNRKRFFTNLISELNSYGFYF